jgi:hypothetical protein
MTKTRYAAELEQVKSVYNADIASNAELILEVANKAWSTFVLDTDLSSEEFERIGEIFRRTAIACVASGRNDAPIWRSRSLTLFTLGESSNGVAMLILASALSTFGEGDVDGALAQLGLMDLLIKPDGGVIGADLVRSALLENTAILRISQGDWESARKALSAVMELEVANGDFRRMQKAKASLATIEYRSGDANTAIADLARIVEECETDGGAGSIVEIGTENLRLMRSGEWPLRPYQVI